MQLNNERIFDHLAFSIKSKWQYIWTSFT